MSDSEVSRWLADHARPLAVADDLPADPADPADPDDPADPVDAWVRASAGARVLAVGPAVGGTREVALLACRVIESAVRDGGAGTLALQAGESATTVLDDHVRHGTGSAGDALERLGSWSWNTREVLDLVRLLAQEAPVPVVGIDPRRPATAVRVVGAFLRTAAPEALPPVADALADLALGHGAGHGGADSRAAVDRVRERLDRDVPALIAATSPARYAEAVRHTGFLARAAELAATPPGHADAVAARLMADAVLEALDDRGTGGRLVLWAHADHVVARDGSLGAHLRERLGDDGYRALVLSAGSGSTRAVRVRRLFGRARTPSVHRLPAADPSSLEATVLRACPRDSLVDLRDLRDPTDPTVPEVPAAVTSWAGTPTSRRSVGDEVSPAAPVGAEVPCVPGGELDGVAVVATVRPGWVR